MSVSRFDGHHPNEPEPLLTIYDVARLLNISVRQARYMAERKTITRVELGPRLHRYLPSEIYPLASGVPSSTDR